MENKFQKNLFEVEEKRPGLQMVLLYGLGDFQKRGFELIGRKLPLDRLLGAFKRSFEHFGLAEVNDREIAETLKNMGAEIDEVPSYVAKHPFRVTVFEDLARKGNEVYRSEIEEENEK